MSIRMRTVYVVNGFRGDCKTWADEARAMGQAVEVVRVAWVGPAWKCPGCLTHSHR